MLSTRALQLASPALPVGAYSYSQGLEWAIESGVVTDSISARRWIEDHLAHVFAKYEAPIWSKAYAAWHGLDRESIRALNEQFIASRESSEPRAETLQVGFSYAAWCRDVPPISDTQREILGSLPRVCAPVAAALASCASGVSARDGLVAYVFGFAENQVMVLSKALPLGQIASQKLLFSLGDAVSNCVSFALELPESAWCSAAPLLAIAQMKHETQYSRLFRS